MSKTTLYPTAVSEAFAFTDRYTTAAQLSPGLGYWLKFNGTENVVISGYPILQETVSVHLGWNLIGSLTKVMSKNWIGSIPPGIGTSDLYEYSSGYTSVDSTRPGHGYWIKVSQAGQLIFTSMDLLPSCQRIRILPTEGTPPPPPSEVASGSQSVPKEYSLDQNYPNPFNPQTTISFGIPVSSHVKLGVFNVLGEEVARLVDEEKQSGFYDATWDASSYPSGVYFYRLQAGTFVETKKLILMK